MSKLFPIPLQGSDSSEVESLPSYIARIAYQHGISIGDIIRFAYAHNDSDYRRSTTVYVEPEEILQANRTTAYLSSSLEKCTGQSLEQATLMWLTNVFGRSSNDIVKGFRWCPECLSEMESLGIEPYFKLKWHLTCVRYCPLHLVDFISICESCGCDQTGYSRKFSVSVCQQCGQSLAKRMSKIECKDVHQSWSDNASDIQKLFSDMAETDFKTLPSGGVLKSFRALVKWCRDNKELDRLYHVLGKEEVRLLAGSQWAMSLTTVRRISYKLGVPLYTFMNGELLEESKCLELNRSSKLSLDFLEPKRKDVHNHELILKKLKSSIDEFNSPPTIKAVARSAGISIGYIRYRYPVLLREIVQNHQDFVEKEHLHKIYVAQKMALSYFLDLKYSTSPKSKRQAYKEVKKVTNLPKGVIEKSIERAYGALYG